ncbi:DUF2628 domain-containing protein [Mesorhizobium sp. RP14(2022)]|uniref:DUF2628 domain-containing protein n=1 Tax=Mesorhizobium liriopis TaxID=2953882 RepID=A0ABT1C254_9HYPH|nr:DUF2628 domain-containing protein [Mesorhizobium liriopis]MCO6048895.1 DUF2628 domain-containing protein [Mesorhizobium liriopis]
MASFVAMEPPEGGPSDRTIFVRDRFTFWAFLLPFVWFLLNRMPFMAVMSLLVVFGLFMLMTLPDFGLVGLLILLLVLFGFGLEAPVLKIRSLRGKGWHEAGTIDARSFRDAELRYFTGAVPTGTDSSWRERLPWFATPAEETAR